MPQSTQASQPALQWVSMLSGVPFFFAAASRKILSPCSPMLRQVSTSSSQIAAASFHAIAARSLRGPVAQGSAHPLERPAQIDRRGRVASSRSCARSSSSSDASSRIASAMP